MNSFSRSVRFSAALQTLSVSLGITLLVTALTYTLPDNLVTTGVGLTFLGAAYALVLRGDSDKIRHYGLSLGGLLEPEPLAKTRLLRALGSALGWALLMALIFFPAFWFGFKIWWRVSTPFASAPLLRVLDDFAGNVLVIALPEEAFYRGYVQTAYDDLWRPRLKVFGAYLGAGVVLTSAVFALGHLLTEFHPHRLAVFFPSLVFGWLRARTGGIGAGVIFHALCNVFASYLAQSYGLSR